MERKRLSDILPGAGGLADTWAKTEAAAEFAPLPKGEYDAVIVQGELFTARTGTPGYKLTFEVGEGDCAGRRFWHDVWLTPAALPLAKRDLGKLGITRLEQLEQPLPARFCCRVKLALLILLDYLQRIRPPGEHGDKRGSADASMDYLRRFADAGVAIPAVAAVGRTKDGRGRSSCDVNGLGLASFKESGELEYGADSAYLLCPEGRGGDAVTLERFRTAYPPGRGRTAPDGRARDGSPFGGPAEGAAQPGQGPQGHTRQGPDGGALQGGE
jgi:hypothetical protein